VLKSIVPKECWGAGQLGGENEQNVMRSVDRFIDARKFEGFSLHEVLQGIKVGELKTSVSP